MSIGLVGGVMAGERKAMAVKLTIESIEAAKIAAAFKGMNLMEYASAVLLEQANRDIEEGYRDRSGEPKAPKRRKGGDQ